MKRKTDSKPIKTIEQFEEYLFSHFTATFSSIEEVNTFEHYDLTGDNEHDYSQLRKVYKVLGACHPCTDAEEHQEVFILLFGKKGGKTNGIYDSKSLGIQSDTLEQMWRLIDWEE